MSKTNLSYESVERALSENNGDLKASANALNVKYITFYWWVKKLNLEYVNKKSGLEISGEELQREYDCLGSFSAVAKKYNVSSECVRDTMLRNNLRINKSKLYTCNHDFFKQETEKAFYWAGFIAADGCLRRNSNIYIGLAKKDKCQLELFKEHIKFDGPIYNVIGKNSLRNPKWKDSEKSEISITSKTMFDNLGKLFGIYPRKSLIYKFPENLINHPLINHFMRGYFDGDGSFYITKYKTKSDQLYFSLRGTPDFLKIYRSILERECDIHIKTKDIRINNNCGVLEYGGNVITRKIADFLYNNASIYLKRKYDKVYSKELNNVQTHQSHRMHSTTSTNI